MSECIISTGTVAWEVVGSMGFKANFHLMQLLKSYFGVILGASVIVGKISNSN